MESHCDYFIYFPAAPVPGLSQLSEIRSLPRRKQVYLGETVQVLLVLKFREDSSGSWRHLARSLAAVGSVCAAETRQWRLGEDEPEIQTSSCSEDEEEEEPGDRGDGTRTFIDCRPLLMHSNLARERRKAGGEPVESPLVLDDQVVFCLTVSLDKLPVNTIKAKVVVTVWNQDEEEAEVREHGYLTLLQLKSPTHTFRQDQSSFKSQVSTFLKVLPPPSVQCQQMTVSGKHLTVLKVLNSSSQEELCLRDMKILPNYNSSYLPMMPDGSVLVVDNVCHQSSEVSMASFCRIDSESSRLPSMLSALEEQNFLFQLQLQNTEEEDSSEGLEVPLVAVLQWYTPTLPYTRFISSCYFLPSIHLDRPRLVMTASCPRAVRPLEFFWVKYTLLNDLQDFLSVRLIWNAEAQRGSQQDSGSGSVVCQSPLNYLGRCRKGSILSFSVAFQILHTGLFELSQHMKLKLQFTTPPVESPSPLKNPPSASQSSSPSAAVRDLQQGHSLGRSQSFTHQRPVRSQHVRSGSVMDRRVVTPPVGSPAGRPLAPEHALISLEKIAKRECKVLVLEPVHHPHSSHPWPEKTKSWMKRKEEKREKREREKEVKE
ncbi:microtubule-associated protein 11 [Xyrichtys novacula]|uniref:Microtubule-associated protein 11 n=1 Tax=Xyrichtys novacula TaxID=13765 RepID=A0AAV1HP35_XYRNO|nr:microtubule-associated protein 11 [Xyrichtys novacula]